MSNFNRGGAKISTHDMVIQAITREQYYDPAGNAGNPIMWRPTHHRQPLSKPESRADLMTVGVMT